MTTMNPLRQIFSLLAFACFTAGAAEVHVERLPAGAMQPQAVVDAAGDVHLVWLRGEPKACDVFYEKRVGGRTNNTVVLRVNSQPGSAIAAGTIRGAQLAVGRGGHVHVVWNGSSTAEPKPAEGSPILYARLNERGDAFEPQRNLSGRTAQLDGGGGVVADGEGRVLAFWHASPDETVTGEKERRVFLAVSKDDGGSFAAERAISPPNGTCGCCALRASIDPAGNLLLLYRSAAEIAQRDMLLLVSRDHGITFSEAMSDAWPVGQCPMSTASFASGAPGLYAAWESKGQVFGSFAAPDLKAFSAPMALAPARGSKHPALAINRRGEAVVAWADGTGWQKGGSVSWRTLDATGLPTGETTTVTDLPVWSFPAVFARPDGPFVVVF
jgi:hypothetical protein